MIATAPAADGGIGHADFVSTDEILVRVDGLLFFANAHRLKDVVRARVSEQPAATRVVVDASRVTDADATVAEMLAELGAISPATGSRSSSPSCGHRCGVC